MCINDWRAGALIRSQTTLYTGIGVDILIIAANLQRVGITFLAGDLVTSTAALVTVDGVAPFVVGGVAAARYHFTFSTHGDLSTKRFTVEVRLGDTVRGRGSGGC